MSTADDPDDEKTLSGPPPSAARAGPRDDPETGIHAERRRGRAAAELQPGHTLPFGTRLRDYEITGLIGEGGFGIVYLAWDHSLQRKVAIKEYMPASMAARVNGSSAIVVKSERHLDTFRAGLKSFVNEARLLARFDHPSLVKVYRFWEENGTAYMVMPYYEGPTLKAALAELGRAPSEDELRAWLKPLLDALAVMHASQCYHRDISPDNILLTPRGPLLLDFGAARRVIGDMTHAITVVLKPGYAPIEQYGDVATMAQGAWTDLYALACVVYYAIAGKTPTSSVERLMDDRVEPLAVRAAGRYSDSFLRAIDAALAVRPGDRPQTEREFRALLDADRPARPAGDAPSSGAPSAWSEPSSWSDPPTEIAPPARLDDPASVWTRADAPSLPLSPVGAPAAPMALRPTSPALSDPATQDGRSGAGRNPAATILIGAAIVAVIATVVLFAWLQQRGAAPRTASSAASGVAAQSASSIAAPSMPPAATAPATPRDRAPTAPVAVESPAAIDPSPARAAVDATPTATSPGATPPVEHPSNGVPASAEAKIDRPAESRITDTATPPPTLSMERAADGGAASAVAATPARTPRPRRESPATPRVDNAAVARPAPPPPPTVSARCSDILQKASLEPLTATEAAYLKRECR